MKDSLLGLRSSTPKSQIPIQADWILRMPHDWRVAFLQGVSDGDGWANITEPNVGITSMVNKDFLIRLLASLGVEASRSTTNVIIRKKDAIRRVARLPMFRHAAGRQERLARIIVILDSVKRRRISEEELKTIMALHKQHFSSGQITKELLSKFGIFRRSGTIRSAIKRNSKKG
jgi:intein/homing endonuclease